MNNFDGKTALDQEAFKMVSHLDINYIHTMAPDMVEYEDVPGEIERFYAGQTIFITGATGFLGNVFVEKLLRTCSRIKSLYLLVRVKKGKDTQTRFNEIFEEPCFDNLKRIRPDFMRRVNLINGDCNLPNLGLSKNDKELLIKEVTCIIHCAATVRFDQHIKTAFNINVRSTRDLLQIAKKMNQLQAFLYISTAYSNCIRKDIEEKFYDPVMTADQLFMLCNALDDEKLLKITPTIIGDYPNTYVFTKAVAEDVIRKESGNLPLCVVRPSIVIASVNEPLAGWITNLYGVTGVLHGVSLGLLRVVPIRSEYKADLIPVDYVVNCSLAATWEVATKRHGQTVEERGKSREAIIYNIVSSAESPINWQRVTDLTNFHARHYPTEHQVWYPVYVFPGNMKNYYRIAFFLHVIPAYIGDFIAKHIGKKQIMVEGYKKVNKFIEVIGYFSLREWKWTNDNVQLLWEKMNITDRRNFQFSMAKFDWDVYWETYMKGGRVYLIKDPLSTLPKGQKKMRKLFWIHYGLLAVLFLLLFMLLSFLFSLLLRI